MLATPTSSSFRVAHTASLDRAGAGADAGAGVGAGAGAGGFGGVGGGYLSSCQPSDAYAGPQLQEGAGGGRGGGGQPGGPGAQQPPGEVRGRSGETSLQYTWHS